MLRVKFSSIVLASTAKIRKSGAPIARVIVCPLPTIVTGFEIASPDGPKVPLPIVVRLIVAPVNAGEKMIVSASGAALV